MTIREWIHVIPRLVFAAALLWPVVTRFIKKRRSKSWPVTTARIETFEARRDHVPRSFAVRILCQVGYSFTVDGSYYSGNFALHAATEAVVVDDQAAEDLGRVLIGRTLEVRYDPKRPDDSIPAEKEFEGRKIEFMRN
ncbi:MAG: DUF3592 domain-containing protein [Acidobacteriales bacterium]|nr:DUF3592 domain-containing protein [Terriglobales bacterium]